MNVAELIEILEKHDKNKEVMISWEGQKIAISPQDIMQEHNLVEIWSDNYNYASEIVKR